MSQVQFKSSQTATSATLTAAPSKPASLAVGDLMIGHAVASASSGTPVISAPVGWTQIRQTSGGTSSAMATFQKIADSADVAASTFTFTSTGTVQQGMVAAVTRLTEQYPTTPIDQNNGAALTSASLTTTGISPTIATGTFLILTGYFAGATRTVSTYAIATSNPTWTEAYDVSVGSAVGISMAYAPRDVLTATGSATATVSGAVIDDFIHIINIVPPPITTVSTASTLFAPTIVTLIGSTISAIATAIAPTATTIAKTWTNAAKNTSAWINSSKS